MNETRALLRHTIATLAYRGWKSLALAPAEFGDFRAAASARTPVQILAHVGDLFDWALSLVQGQHVWHDSTPLPWDDEVARFFGALRRLDDFLARDAPLGCTEGKLFQGPIADALTHIGQIALLRRLAGAPIRGENYFKADIERGRVGADQPPSRVEFD